MNLANLITTGRILMAPVLVLLAWYGHEHAYLGCLVASLVSDIVDGQLARRCGMATPLGAKLDSWADFLTSLTLVPGLFWLHRYLLPEMGAYFLVAVASYLLPIGFGFAKFRALTSYHTFMARVAAYAMGAAVVVLFGRGPTLPFKAAVVLLAVSGVEEIAISVVLKSPRSDVGSLKKVLASAPVQEK